MNVPLKRKYMQPATLVEKNNSTRSQLTYCVLCWSVELCEVIARELGVALILGTVPVHTGRGLLVVDAVVALTGAGTESVGAWK